MTLINITEAAELTGFSVKTLRNWISKRKIPYYKIAGVRFNPEELSSFIASKKVEPVDDEELEQKACAILNGNARKKGVHK